MGKAVGEERKRKKRGKEGGRGEKRYHCQGFPGKAVLIAMETATIKLWRIVVKYNLITILVYCKHMHFACLSLHYYVCTAWQQ